MNLPIETKSLHAERVAITVRESYQATAAEKRKHHPRALKPVQPDRVRLFILALRERERQNFLRTAQSQSSFNALQALT